MQNVQELTLDVNLPARKQLRMKQGDTLSRYIQITLTGCNLTGQSVKIYIEKPDGTKIYNNCTITDASNGIILVEMTSQALAVPGKMECQLEIIGADNSLLSSFSFFIHVEKTIVDGDAIESKDEFTALTLALAEVTGYNTRLDGIDSDLTEKATEDQYYVTNIGVVDIVNAPERIFAINNTNMLAFLATHADAELYFPAGTYNHATALTFTTGVSLRLHRNAKIVSTADMDYMFNFAGTAFKINQKVCGGMLDGDKKATDILRLNNFSKFYVDHVHFLDAKNRSIVAGSDGVNGGGLFVTNSYIENQGTDYTNTDNVGMYINCTDSCFINVVMKDVTIGVINCASGGNNKFINVHPWISQQDRLPYTKGFVQPDTSGANGKYVDCDVDTCQVGFYVGSQTEAFFEGCDVYDNIAFRYSTQPVAFSIHPDHYFIRGLNCHVNGNARNSDGTSEIGRKMCDLASVIGYFNNTRFHGTVTNKIEDTAMHTNASFTPTIYGANVAGSPTYTTQTGKYTRVGNLVNANIVIVATLDNLIDGAIRIGGLPYTAAGDTSIGIGYHSGWGSASYPSNGYIADGQQYIKLYRTVSGVMSTLDALSFRGTTVQLFLSVTYKANFAYI